MTDPALLFREEALLSRQEDLRSQYDPPGPTGSGAHRRPGSVGPRWIARAYWALLVLVAAGLIGSTQLRVGEFARGPAVVRGGTMVAVVPAVFASELRAGLPLELRLRGRAPVTVTIGSTGPELTGTVAAGKLLGTDVTGAGLPQGTLPQGTLLVVRAAVAPGIAGTGIGTASIQVGSQRLIVTLATGLNPQSGAGDG